MAHPRGMGTILSNISAPNYNNPYAPRERG